MKINYRRLFCDQTKIICLISSGNSLKETLQLIVTSIELHFHSVTAFGSIMLYDPATKRLGETVSSSLPKDFLNSIEPVFVGPHEGSCGSAAFYKYPRIVTDLEYASLWINYFYLAKDFGLHSCWSTPILSSTKELLGTFDLYFSESYRPDAKAIETLERYNKLAAIAIELSKSSINYKTNAYAL